MVLIQMYELAMYCIPQWFEKWVVFSINGSRCVVVMLYFPYENGLWKNDGFTSRLNNMLRATATD